MKTGESRAKGGVGFLPLQGHNTRWPIKDRPSVLASRMVDRLDSTDQLGHWVYEEETVGDVLCALNWPRNTRDISGWSWAWPSVVAAGKGGDVATPGGKTRCGVAPDNSLQVLPVIDEDWKPDGRFKPIKRNLPKRKKKNLWPKPAGDTFGIMCAATNEDKQVELFLPIDPRLIAVNYAGDPKMGSLVCDLDQKFNVDPDRMSPLQSAFRVIKEPLGRPNVIGLQLGPSGCEDVGGGYYVDKIGLDFIVGVGSRTQGGPFDVGSKTDKHALGVDADGNVINMLHWNCDTTNFRRSDFQDGPLMFEGTYKGGTESGHNKRVYLEFDGLKWRWRSKCEWYPVTTRGGRRGPPPLPRPDTPTPPLRPPPGVPTPPLGRPSTPSGGDRGLPLPPGGPGFDGRVPPLGPDVPTIDRNKPDIHTRAVLTDLLPFIASLMEVAVPSLIFRPQNFTPGIPDLRNMLSLSEDLIGKVDAETPVSIRCEGFGAQGGQILGDDAGEQSTTDRVEGGSNEPWVYTQRPGNAGYKGGTANGGICYLPPEVGLEDSADSLAPDRVSRSTCYVMVGPNAYFGAGRPQLESGGLRNGYSWGMDSNGNLVFRNHCGDEAFEAIRFNRGSNLGGAGQTISWKSDTGNWAELSHIASGAQDYIFPDMTGYVVLAEFDFFDTGSIPFGHTTGALLESADLTWTDGSSRLNTLGFATKATSPAQLTGDVNNYNPGNGVFFRMSSDASRTITGIAGGADGRRMLLVNVGANNIVLANSSGSSSAANQIITGTGGDITIAALGRAELIYDSTSTRWRVIGT